MNIFSALVPNPDVLDLSPVYNIAMTNDVQVRVEI